ncbi:aldose epimerase family protein [Granulicella tundricola]|uniref:Aldose 1-epimerase n=1 Tax=Granulicella tundricola (strain ATCC BAA-1859 / DSM 23138 / MP5ACTX9) TaxID=1198114 RepID=E8WW96_GRATM|nr:aldose 1-epimerase [Granulicella tundricola]ADW68479.1 Aldose 1-epimerase [Granulicella tundricola MP5ACTX9]
MYLNIIKKRLEDVWHGVFGREGRRSAAFPLLVILVVLAGTGAIYLAHRHAKFHELETKIQGDTNPAGGGEERPGGRDPIVLTRAQTLGGYVPEFHSATLLPGLGLGVLQITAFLPNKGEQPLLVAPTVPQMTDGSWPVRTGSNDVHGALEAPWSGLFAGVTSPTGLTLSSQWNDKMLTIPVQPQQAASLAEGGLLQGQDTDTAEVTKTDKGAVLSGTFRARDFDGHWPSSSDVSVRADLQATTLELTVDAKNAGDQPEPMGLGWHPRFLIQSGDRSKVELKLPNGEKLLIASSTPAIPTGKTGALGAALQGFAGRGGALGDDSVDEAMVHLKPSASEQGPTAEMRDPAAGYGLRITAVSATIREMRVYAPARGNFVSVGTQTNYDDPFGHEWNADDSPIATLLPGQTIEWKVRLELFPIPGR